MLNLQGKINFFVRSKQNILNFVNSTRKTLDEIGCKENDCKIAHFINSMSNLLKEDHPFNEKKGFFLASAPKIKPCLNLYVLLIVRVKIIFLSVVNILKNSLVWIVVLNSSTPWLKTMIRLSILVDFVKKYTT